MNTSPTPLTFAQRLALIVGGLCQAVAACGGRQMVGFDWRWHDPAIVPLVVPIWGRLKRALARFEALMARYRAGRPMAPRARRRAAPAPAAPAPAASRPDRLALPSRYAWLGRLLPEAFSYGGQLQTMMAEPGMLEFLAACPQAGRIVRPLCRMLAVPVAGTPWALPPRVRTAPPRTRPRARPRSQPPRPPPPAPMPVIAVASPVRVGRTGPPGRLIMPR